MVRILLIKLSFRYLFNHFFSGWQVRFIVLKDSTLSYYKSAEDSDYGCRGAICLEKATIKTHEIDECRFDISVENVVWYLRADSMEDKKNWVEVLKSYRVRYLKQICEYVLFY
jgi:collagen type IV alpha-3-binding protein